MGDPLVRAVARLPVNVRTKLLIAFVGTSLLLVAVGLLGQLVLGQSNDRVASVGPLQKGPSDTASSSRGRDLRDVLSENAGPTSARLADVRLDVAEVLARGGSVRGRRGPRVAASTAADRLRFTPPPEDEDVLGGIEDKADELSGLMVEEIIPLYDGRATISDERREDAADTERMRSRSRAISYRTPRAR